MNILGIDPGTHRIGWGVIKKSLPNPLYKTHGCIEITSHTATDSYLKTIYNDIQSIIEASEPELAAIEKVFFQKNVKTAMTVSQARGVIILALAQNNIPIVEFSPNTIKLAVTGSGRAPKNQVQKMVQLLLSLDSIPKPDDAADALAVAITASVNNGGLYDSLP